MSDIVERARNRNMPRGHLELIDKLADEIERLQAALKAIADYEQDYGGYDWGWRDIAEKTLGKKTVESDNDEKKSVDVTKA